MHSLLSSLNLGIRSVCQNTQGIIRDGWEAFCHRCLKTSVIRKVMRNGEKRKEKDCQYLVVTE